MEILGSDDWGIGLPLTLLSVYTTLGNSCDVYHTADGPLTRGSSQFGGSGERRSIFEPRRPVRQDYPLDASVGSAPYRCLIVIDKLPQGPGPSGCLARL